MADPHALEVLCAAAIDRALHAEYRQYLTGRLSRPQEQLPAIDDDIEVGISHYRTFTADKPHCHPIATEHGYVLEGAIRIRLLDGSAAERECRAGDFFVIQCGTPYATKNAPGTKVLFIKSPGGNDKALVPVDDDTRRWLSSWDCE